MKLKFLFSGLMLSLVCKSLFSQNFHAGDCAALVAIDLACDASNQLNWNTDPNPANWSGITWNLNTPKRVTEIKVGPKNLTGILDVTPLDDITILNCDVNQLTELKIANLQKLSMIECSNNLFTGMDLSNLPKLDWLNCMSNQITDLDLSGCPNLTILQTQVNPIGNLDLTAVPKLRSLGCYSNQLDSLDVSHLTDLNSLACYSNNLKKLDVSNLTNLTLLHCLNNPLDSLDIRNLTNLKDLHCRDNNLSRLDLSNQINLERLHCSNNQIDSLDVSNLTKLKEFNCSENLLTRIDVSNLTQLTELNCSNNQLSELDLSNLDNLRNFNCGYNRIDTLDVSNLVNLLSLICDGNQLTSLDVSNLTKLDDLSCKLNEIPFSSLPLNAGYTTYNYSPMDTLYDTLTVYSTFEMDYSSEAMIDGNTTDFIFYKYGFPVDTNNTGLFTTTSQGIYHCEMTNATFPGLTEITSSITYSGVAELSVSETELETGYVANSSASFDITSNTAWNIISSESWLSVNPSSGVNNNAITLTAEANTYFASRTATITVSGTGVNSIDITVTQAGKTVSSLVEQFSKNELFFPNPVQERLNIKLTSEYLPAAISLYTLDGKQLISTNTVIETTHLDMSDFQSGMYLLKITTPKQSFEESIIKK